MRVFLRGFLRLGLAGALGLGIAYPVRALFPRSDAPDAVSSSAPSKPEADGADAETGTQSKRAEQAPHPTGVAMTAARVLVSMSDGTVRVGYVGEPELSDGISQVTPSSVTIDGRKLFVRPGPRSEVSRPAAAVSPEFSLAAPSSSGSAVQSSGAWRLDPDGVYRIAERSSIGGR